MSPQQAKFLAAAEHDPAFAAKVGFDVPKEQPAPPRSKVIAALLGARLFDQKKLL